MKAACRPRSGPNELCRGGRQSLTLGVTAGGHVGNDIRGNMDDIEDIADILDFADIADIADMDDIDDIADIDDIDDIADIADIAVVAARCVTSSE